MRKFLIALMLAGFTIFTACGDGNQPKPVTDDKEANTGTVQPAARPAVGGGQSATPGGGATATVEKPASLVKLEKAYEANPNDAEAKKKLAEATYEFGHNVMLDNSLGPKVKYPEARRQFKRVLELDPNHEQAAAEKKQIEDIYASMGRPVPE
jgi:hypothetical protein